MVRCGYLATLISLSIGAENSDLRNKKNPHTLNQKIKKKSRVTELKTFDSILFLLVNLKIKSLIESLKKVMTDMS